MRFSGLVANGCQLLPRTKMPKTAMPIDHVTRRHFPMRAYARNAIYHRSPGQLSMELANI